MHWFLRASNARQQSKGVKPSKEARVDTTSLLSRIREKATDVNFQPTLGFIDASSCWRFSLKEDKEGKGYGHIEVQKGVRNLVSMTYHKEVLDRVLGCWLYTDDATWRPCYAYAYAYATPWEPWEEPSRIHQTKGTNKHLHKYIIS